METHKDAAVHVAGAGAAGLIAAYAAVLEPEIAGVSAIQPPASHMHPGALQVHRRPRQAGALTPAQTGPERQGNDRAVLGRQGR